MIASQKLFLSSKSFFWLSKRIGIEPELLKCILIDLRREQEGKRTSGLLYKKVVINKAGKKRKIHIPQNGLKEIQRNINRRILAQIPINNNAFGFSGGSITDAIEPHLDSSIIWLCDIKDAFPSTFRERVFGAFRSYFSKPVSNLLTLLTTLPSSGTLPQGAPTSPRVFDLSMKTINSELSRIAESLGFVYTRYADNIFFSFVGEIGNAPMLEREIFDLLGMAELVPHKIKFKKLNGVDAVRLLGLNIMDGRIHNTRDFKNRLRIAIHHVGWLLNHGQANTAEFITAWNKLQGQMNFARIDTLPPKMLNSYLNLKLRVSWASIF